MALPLSFDAEPATLAALAEIRHAPDVVTAFAHVRRWRALVASAEAAWRRGHADPERCAVLHTQWQVARHAARVAAEACQRRFGAQPLS